MNDLFKIFVSTVALIIGAMAFAHKAHKHIETTPKPVADEVRVKLVMEQINAAYKKEIKPIFQRTCYDCHSQNTRYPWYSNIPGVKQLIASDIKEARKHLDLTDDYPFKGHGSPQEDLDAIEEAIKNNEMPPWRYRLMHADARINDEEKSKIFEWIDVSRKKIESNGEEK